MFSKYTGFLLIPFWMASMSWLFYHDVWPAWSAQQAPNLNVDAWLKIDQRERQWSILQQGRRVGTIWSTTRIDEETITRDDIVVVREFINIPGPFRFDTHMTLRADGLLDEFTLFVRGPAFSVDLHGERFHSDFSFELSTGAMTRNFKVPIAKAGMISGAFSPIAQLDEVEVGQRWRMQVTNPLNTLTGMGDPFISVVVEVTGLEDISTYVGTIPCHIIESPMVKAWVSEQGTVMRQEITIAGAGSYTIEAEAFNRERWQAMIAGSGLMTGEPRR